MLSLLSLLAGIARQPLFSEILSHSTYRSGCMLFVGSLRHASAGCPPICSSKNLQTNIHR